jgi:DNA-binding transcriptional LysR family regulator
MPEVTLRQLEYFIAAADAGTVTAAADRLHLSQSALSMALSELERAVKVQLLVRDRRGIRLTPVGEEVLSDARRLVAGVADLPNIAAEFQGSMSGRLVVGCYSTLSPLLLPPVLAEFAAAHPDVELSIVEGSQGMLEEQLRSGVVDVALMYDYQRASFTGDRGLLGQPVVTSPPYVLLPEGHSLTRRPEVTLEDLAGEPLILFDLPPGGEYFLSLFTDAGLEARVRYRTQSYELVRSLVARGLGYSILSQRTRIRVSYEDRSFETRDLSGRHPGLTVHAVRLAGTNPTRRARAFVEACQSCWSGSAR